jgi:hypothetical protein
MGTIETFAKPLFLADITWLGMIGRSQKQNIPIFAEKLPGWKNGGKTNRVLLCPPQTPQ